MKISIQMIGISKAAGQMACYGNGAVFPLKPASACLALPGQRCRFSRRVRAESSHSPNPRVASRTKWTVWLSARMALLPVLAPTRGEDCLSFDVSRRTALSSARLGLAVARRSGLCTTSLMIAPSTTYVTSSIKETPRLPSTWLSTA